MVFSTVLAEETAAQAEDLSNVFVVLMGMGTVFVGLICLVILCLLTSFIIRKFVAQPEDEAEVQTKAPAVSESPIANRQEFIAAVSAAIAEELGTSVNAIRIKSHSFAFPFVSSPATAPASAASRMTAVSAS